MSFDEITGWNIGSRAALPRLRFGNDAEWGLSAGFEQSPNSNLSLDFGLTLEGVLQKFYLAGPSARLRLHSSGFLKFMDLALTGRGVLGVQKNDWAARVGMGFEAGIGIPIGARQSLRFFAGLEGRFFITGHQADWAFVAGLSLYNLFAEKVPPPLPLPLSPVSSKPPEPTVSVMKPVPPKMPEEKKKTEPEKPKASEETVIVVSSESKETEEEKKTKKEQKIKELKEQSLRAEMTGDFEKAHEIEKQIIELNPDADHSRRFYFALMKVYEEIGNIPREQYNDLVNKELAPMASQGRLRDVAKALSLFLESIGEGFSDNPERWHVNILIVFKTAFDIFYDEEIQTRQNLDRAEFSKKFQERLGVKNGGKKKEKLARQPGVVDGLVLFLRIYQKMENPPVSLEDDAFDDFDVSVKKVLKR
ncbi:MAG: hypothetical protein HY877_07450 [Deltaproteobacteria bacterium]|nr:hypothetical protein [Deltaproteobacteria bacterium]